MIFVITLVAGKFETNGWISALPVEAYFAGKATLTQFSCPWEVNCLWENIVISDMIVFRWLISYNYVDFNGIKEFNVIVYAMSLHIVHLL